VARSRDGFIVLLDMSFKRRSRASSFWTIDRRKKTRARRVFLGDFNGGFHLHLATAVSTVSATL
jgi:hypothetical protein